MTEFSFVFFIISFIAFSIGQQPGIFLHLDTKIAVTLTKLRLESMCSRQKKVEKH